MVKLYVILAESKLKTKLKLKVVNCLCKYQQVPSTLEVDKQTHLFERRRA